MIENRYSCRWICRNRPLLSFPYCCQYAVLFPDSWTARRSLSASPLDCGYRGRVSPRIGSSVTSPVWILRLAWPSLQERASSLGAVGWHYLHVAFLIPVDVNFFNAWIVFRNLVKPLLHRTLFFYLQNSRRRICLATTRLPCNLMVPGKLAVEFFLRHGT